MFRLILPVFCFIIFRCLDLSLIIPAYLSLLSLNIFFLSSRSVSLRLFHYMSRSLSGWFIISLLHSAHSIISVYPLSHRSLSLSFLHFLPSSHSLSECFNMSSFLGSFLSSSLLPSVHTFIPLFIEFYMWFSSSVWKRKKKYLVLPNIPWISSPIPFPIKFASMDIFCFLTLVSHSLIV